MMGNQYAMNLVYMDKDLFRRADKIRRDSLPSKRLGQYGKTTT